MSRVAVVRSRLIVACIVATAAVGLADCGAQTHGGDRAAGAVIATKGMAGHGQTALRWAPPQLTKPTTVTVGQGYTELHLNPAEDYVIKLPKVDKVGSLALIGGHNIVLIGGHITLPSDIPPGKANYKYRMGIYIKNSTGTVHIEGVLLDAAPGDMWDGVDINAPLATVQLENIRIDGIEGTYYGFHGDVVQPWGGVRDLRIDRLSGTTDDQGLTIPIELGAIGSAELSHIDIRGFGGEAQRGGQLLWLTSGSESCRSYPVQLEDVYLQPRPGRRLGDSIWPERNLPRACAASARRRSADWPLLPSLHGRVIAGIPRGGTYVPASLVGVGYVSPGYMP